MFSFPSYPFFTKLYTMTERWDSSKLPRAHVKFLLNSYNIALIWGILQILLMPNIVIVFIFPYPFAICYVHSNGFSDWNSFFSLFHTGKIPLRFQKEILGRRIWKEFRLHKAETTFFGFVFRTFGCCFGRLWEFVSFRIFDNIYPSPFSSYKSGTVDLQPPDISVTSAIYLSCTAWPKNFSASFSPLLSTFSLLSLGNPFK